MRFKFRSLAPAAVLATISMAAAGCGDGGSSTPATTSARATTNDAAPITTAGSTGALPTECQTYLNSVQSCLDRVSAQNQAAAAQVRETLDVNRGAIERLSHDGPPLEYCVSASNAWNSRKGNFGC